MDYMFTGIIQHVGTVVQVRSIRGGKRLRIDAGPIAGSLAPGGSVAVDGACLTVAAAAGGEAEFDAVPETLARTTLGQLAQGSAVNLEPALAAGAPLDGHIVQGHVDGMATVVGAERAGGAHMLRLAAPAELVAQMVPKGSVALAGVSLTLVDVGGEGFSVALVPTTLQRTTLGKVKPSDSVNLELDVIGKYVRRYLHELAGGGGVTIEKLREEGFA